MRPQPHFSRRLPWRPPTTTITIGFTTSQTGALNVDSLAQLRGFEMWRDDVNAAGGIKAGGKPYKVKFVSYDDQSQGGRVQQLYTRLIVQDKAQFLFSPYSSGLAATAAVISEQYGKIMIIAGGAEPKTYELGNKYLFQVYTPADHYLTGALQALKLKNAQRQDRASSISDDPFSKAVAIATRDQAKEMGFKIVLDESYRADQTDFSAIINKIISAKPDALLGGGHYPDGATLARQLYDQKAGIKWVTLLVAPDSDQFATLGAPAVGVSAPSQWAPQVNLQTQFRPELGDAFAQALQGEIQRRGRLPLGRRLWRRAAPPARHRTGGLDRPGEGGGGARTRWTSPRCSARQVLHRPAAATACNWRTRWC